MRPSPDNVAEPLVHVERHRAERLADLVVVGSVCCSSCCCCCCCVHTIGGVAGAAAGSAMAVKEVSADAEALRGVQVTNVVYWVGFIAVSLLAIVVGLVSDHIWESLLVVALGAPFFQLGISVLALPVAAAQPPARRRGAFAALRNITLGAIAGAVAGTILFAILGGALGALVTLLR